MDSLTAVFIGATSGIGKATLQAFAKQTTNPTAIIIGRSQKAFAPDLTNLKQLNPTGTFTFIEQDISLLQNIQKVTPLILSALNGKTIDRLYQSQGYLPFNGRELSTEGLDKATSLRYYGKMLFIQNLLPHMSPQARIITILAGGWEGKIFEDDLGLQNNYSLTNEANQYTTMTTLTFDYLSTQNPEKTFLHIFPGVVATGLLGKSTKGIISFLARWFVEPVLKLFMTSPEVSGNRMFTHSMSERFERGSWSLSELGEPKENEILKSYRKRNFADKVVEHNHAVFERVASI